MSDCLDVKFDVIVIGGGHAGIEAAYAAAKMGSKTLLLTPALDTIASMPCNPSIGGLGKGHIVYEISALGGLMPKLCSKTYLQARLLNTSKGPAVQGLRLQIDKYAYSKEASQALQELENLTIVTSMARELMTEDMHASADDGNNGYKKRVTGVICTDNRKFNAPTVVVTTGTFMRGVVHVGLTRYPAGRRGEPTSIGLSQSIAKAMGVSLGRLKTGTPPRLLRSSIDFSVLDQQDTQQLDYLYEFDSMPVKDTLPCYIAYTNTKTHEIIRKNLDLSALYSGNIKGIGPRYCPSIEDKIGRFPDRDSHHVFVEPEGLDCSEVYPSGLSTSLPFNVQEDYIKSMKGFEKAVITKCGYAIEYDFIQPHNLTHTLETKTVSGLFLAGQLNGTTGYEEAAGQGLIAGVNAHLKHTEQESFVLSRNESYIGVMIDDMVTLGVNEPYRMFTSRAERRLLLRQDNVFLRLMPYGKKLGLIDNKLYEAFLAEKDVIETSKKCVKNSGTKSLLFNLFNSVIFSSEVKHQAKTHLVEVLSRKNMYGHVQVMLSSRALLCIHAHVKYDGYLRKELLEIEKYNRYQELEISENLNFKKMSGLTRELQEKLGHYKPKTIAQAQRIPGMTPAALSILIFQMRKI